MTRGFNNVSFSNLKSIMNRLGLVYLLLACVLGCMLGCSTEERRDSSFSSSSAVLVDKDRELVEHVIFDIVDPRLRSFQSHVESMGTQLNAVCKGEGQIEVLELRKLWVAAIMDFHYLEALPFGPLGDQDGKLRKRIYSLPVVDQGLLIEREIQRAAQMGSDYRQTRVRQHLLGFDVLEYVFFEHFERPDEQINKEHQACSYMSFVHKDIHAQTERWVQRWSVEQVDFIRSPEGQSRMREVLSKITGSLILFTDKELKDKKLASAMGLRKELQCPKNNCAGLYLEHPFSAMAKEAVVENLRAISDVLSGKVVDDGKPGFGYKSYFEQSGNLEENHSLITSARDLISRWENLPAGNAYFQLFSEANEVVSKSSNPLEEENEILELYGSLKQITDWMKGDFVVDLNTNLPGSVQGDND